MFDKNPSRTITMSGLFTFKNASRTITICELFILKMPAGQQSYLGFFRCQQENNHIWAFLDANWTTTISGLLSA